MRIAITTFCLTLVITACAGEDLGLRIDAAGVFSPSRSDAGRGRVADLGQLLFFDRELSGNRNAACASCHLPAHHGGDQISLGLGQGAMGTGEIREGGPILPRNTVSPFNRSFANSLLWDGRVERLSDGTIRAPVTLPTGIQTLLEAQALLPLLDRDEMRGQPGDSDVFGSANELAALPDEAPKAVWSAIMARLMSIEEYRRLFVGAFPDTPIGEHSIVHVARAISRFEMRLWELTDTPFDVYLGAEHRAPVEHALTERERAGAELFFGDAGCDRCHNGPLLSDGEFHNIGVARFGPGKRDGIDEGRFLVTGDPADRFAFVTPPLRNVQMTGPYMHNGSVFSLKDAIRLHQGLHTTLDVQIRATIDPTTRPLRSLLEEDILLLEDFLDTFSSLTERIVFPGAGEPERVPSGLPVDHATF